MELVKELQEISNLIAQDRNDLAETQLHEILVKDACCFAAWILLGNVQLKAKKVDDAIASIIKALSLQDRFPYAFYSLAYCYNLKKEYALAIKWATQALELEPDFVEAWSNLGHAQFSLGMLEEASVSFHNGLKLNPDHSEILQYVGLIMINQAKFSEAVPYLKKALKKNENNVSVLEGLCKALVTTGKYPEALSVIEKILFLKPYDKQSVHIKSALLQVLGRSEAVPYLKKALKKNENNVSVLEGLCKALVTTGKYPEALSVIEKILFLKPYDKQSVHIKSALLQVLGRYDEAADLLQRNIERYPDYAESKWNLGWIFLLRGDLKKGFGLCENRLNIGEFWTSGKIPDEPRLWQGEKIDGKTLLVVFEQGYGDGIQFLRYLHYLPKDNCKIIVELPQEMFSLFNHLGFSLTYKKGVEHDLAVHLMSLPYIFKTDLSSIPPPISIKNAQHRPIKNRVGIAWKGSPKNKHDNQRSMNLLLLESLLQLPEIDYVCLQKDPTQGESLLLDAYDVEQPPLETWTETVHIIETCERVISVDTAIAHLAGSMGVPTWILLSYVPDWRWMLERIDSPWYPTARLFRQSIVDSWAEPIEAVRRELQGCAP